MTKPRTWEEWVLINTETGQPAATRFDNKETLDLIYERYISKEFHPIHVRVTEILPDEEKAAELLAPWLSSALDDPSCCEEYKSAIKRWFEATRPCLPAITADEVVRAKTLIKYSAGFERSQRAGTSEHNIWLYGYYSEQELEAMLTLLRAAG